MRIRTRQKIDRVLGPPVCWALTCLKKILPSRKLQTHRFSFSKILIIKFWGMGSILLSADGLYSIKRNYPTSKIYFLTLSRNTELMSYLHFIDYVFTINVDASIFKFAFDIIKVLVKLRKEKLDLVIDMEFFTRFSAIISYLSGVKVISGFHDWNVYRGDLHTIKVPFNRYWHVKKNFENLITQSFGSEFQLYHFKFPITQDDINSLRDVLTKEGITDDKFVVININVGDLAPERRWPIENFTKLTKILIQHYGLKVVFIGSKSEKADVERFITENITYVPCDSVSHGGKSYAVNLAGRLSLAQLAVLFKIAKFTVTNDSGPLHLASMVGGKTVSFFGPETPILYGPLGGDAIVFFKNIDCSPCINVHTGKIVKCTRTTPRCLEYILPEEVIREIETKGWL